ncbi:MAG: hypothetical protein ACI4XR_01475 [Bacilli bacterium]
MVKIKNLLNKAKIIFKDLINNIKLSFKNNKKKSIAILSIIILAILGSITLITYSFYVNKSTNLLIAGVAQINPNDIKINIYREDKDSSGNGLGTYSLSYYIPSETAYTYMEANTTCDDGITITGYTNKTFSVSATKRGTCNVYFDAIDGVAEDYIINLFVQEEVGGTTYKQMGQLPINETGYYYTVNTDKTSCNPSGTVSIENNKILVYASQNTTCNVYADKHKGEILYKTIQTKYTEGNTFVKLYDGDGSDTYANPVYYYNGAVEDNNVLFAGFCWKMVRTTDTGGVKLIYNGVPTNGSCNNTGEASQIGTSEFNSSTESPAYVGYMYNTVYTFSSKSSSALSNIVFGNSFTYSGGTYTLTDTMTVATWSSGYNTINNNHYTCFTTGTTCSSIYYVYYTDSETAYYITLTGGKSVGDALNEMLYADDVNKTNSTIKTYIETWYENNMTSYTSYLEDTTFCNDRSILNLNGLNPNGGSTSSYLQFKNLNYSLVCANETDQFRVGNAKAPLKYPVGLLTAPEVSLAYEDANCSTYYLNTGEYYWLGTPNSFDDNIAHGDIVLNSGVDHRDFVNFPYGVRLSVSLKPGTVFVSGDGSYTSPYLIEAD